MSVSTAETTTPAITPGNVQSTNEIECLTWDLEELQIGLNNLYADQQHSTKAVTDQEYKRRPNRLAEITALLTESAKHGIVRFFQIGDNSCLLGFSEISVKAPLKFRQMVGAMIDTSCNWKNKKYKDSVQANPTWGLHEFLRKMGLVPAERGDFRIGDGTVIDPGKLDMIYYKKWVFHKNQLEVRKVGSRSCADFAAGAAGGGGAGGAGFSVTQTAM